MHEKLNKSNLELKQEIEHLEKELEEEKSKQSDNDNLVRINRILSLLLLIKKKKKPSKKTVWRRQTILLGFFEKNPTFPILPPLIPAVAY